MFFSLFFIVYLIRSRMFQMQIFLHIVVRASLFLSTPSAHFQQSACVCVEFHFKQLWSVIPQLSQNRSRLRCFSSFLKNFFKYAQVEQTCVLSNLFFSRNQPATIDMLKNILVTVQRRIQEACRIEEDLFAVVVNEKLKNVHSCFKTLFQMWQGSWVCP